MNTSRIKDGKDMGMGQCPASKVPDQSDPTKLLKVLECPICLEVANPPIFTCIGNGHMICAECRKRHDVCPLCNTQVSLNRCMFAEQCMEQITLPCKYREDGCQATVQGTKYREHLLTCPYRSVDCIMRKCNAKIPIRKYFQHLRSEHPSTVNGIENTSRHTVEWWIDGSVQPAKWPPYYFTCFNHVFLYMAISTIHGMWEWAWIIANEDEAARFRVSAKMHTVNNLADVQWTGIVHSIRKTIPEIIESGLCFVTNSKDIRNPFLFRKISDAATHLQPRYYWKTEVEFFQIKEPPQNVITAAIPTTDANRVTQSTALPAGISGKISSTMLQGGPAPVTDDVIANPSIIIDDSSPSSPTVGSRSASEADLSQQKINQTRASEPAVRAQSKERPASEPAVRAQSKERPGSKPRDTEMLPPRESLSSRESTPSSGNLPDDDAIDLEDLLQRSSLEDDLTFDRPVSDTVTYPYNLDHEITSEVANSINEHKNSKTKAQRNDVHRSGSKK